jgi:hypothetical protein
MPDPVWTDQSEPYCRNCRWFYVEPTATKHTYGDCTRYPPTPTAIPTSKGGLLNVLPTVMDDYLCGEWKGI